VLSCVIGRIGCHAVSRSLADPRVSASSACADDGCCLSWSGAHASPTVHQAQVRAGVRVWWCFSSTERIILTCRPYELGLICSEDRFPLRIHLCMIRLDLRRSCLLLGKSPTRSSVKQHLTKAYPFPYLELVRDGQSKASFRLFSVQNSTTAAAVVLVWLLRTSLWVLVSRRTVCTGPPVGSGSDFQTRWRQV